MFYEIEVRAHIRVPPSSFTENTKDSVLKNLNEQFEGFISKDLGIVIGVTAIEEIGDGIIIPGDGAAYYDTVFKLIIFKPELQEVVLGRVNEITNFGAFIDIGAIDGMIHISQTMDDFVSLSKSGKTNILTGKESKKVLKVNDECRARIIAVSYKDISNPKIGLTMRQPTLGKLEWLEAELKKKEKEATKEKPKKEPKEKAKKTKVKKK